VVVWQVPAVVTTTPSTHPAHCPTPLPPFLGLCDVTPSFDILQTSDPPLSRHIHTHPSTIHARPTGDAKGVARVGPTTYRARCTAGQPETAGSRRVGPSLTALFPSPSVNTLGWIHSSNWPKRSTQSSVPLPRSCVPCPGKSSPHSLDLPVLS
jgi:hypothetical protein